MNEFKDCLETEKQYAIPCENSADKKAYKDSIFQHIYRDIIQLERDMRVVPPEEDEQEMWSQMMESMRRSYEK